MKQFVCVWIEPEYWSGLSVETIETIEDENRSFSPNVISKVKEMEVGEVLKFKGLIIIRMDDDIEIEMPY